MIVDVAFLAWLMLASQPAGGQRLAASDAVGRPAAVPALRLPPPASRAATAQAPQEPPAPPPPPEQGAQASSESKFNPAISVIPDVEYYNDDRDGEAPGMISGADGFARPGSGDGHGEWERGFNLREVEVAFSAAVDPYFDARAILAIATDSIEAEEVYVQTRALAPGLQARAGKFYSGIGYLNSKHPHQWDFVDAPLPYSQLLAGNLNEVGAQVTWLPALPVYLLLGGELLQGENEAIAQHLGPGENAAFQDLPGPRVFTGFAKFSPNLAGSHTLQVGGSVVHSRSHQELADGADGTEAIQGPGTVVGTDVVYQFDSSQQWGVGDLTVQGEYFWRRQDLAVVWPATTSTARDRTQDGFYAQAVYGFAPRWKVGFRFDAAGLANEVRTASGAREAGSSRRYTADVTFLPTEFSRLRLQYTRADVPVEGVREGANQVWVQLQVSLGAHGAHVF